MTDLVQGLPFVLSITPPPTTENEMEALHPAIAANLQAQLDRPLPNPTTDAEWAAVLKEWRRETLETKEVFARVEAERKARLPLELAAAEAALPTCSGFEGAGARCTACRVHRRVHG